MNQDVSEQILRGLLARSTETDDEGLPAIRLEDLTLRELRLMAVLSAVKDGELDIEVEDGQPVRVRIESPQALAGYGFRIDGDERDFLARLCALLMELRRQSGAQK